MFERVLNIPQVLNIPEYGPPYSSGSQCARACMEMFCEYVKVTQGSV